MVTDAQGQTTTVEYTLQNLVQATRDALGRVTRFTYDEAGNVTSITDPAGQVRTFTYEPVFNKVTALTDPLGQVTRFDYDLKGNLTTIADPLGNTTTRHYDAVSRLIQQTDARGKATSFAYDPLNRVTELTDARGGVTHFSYDGNGNLLTVTDARGNATTHTYDSMDRLASRTDPVKATETFRYDGNGNLTQHIDRKGQVATFGYDPLNRRTSATYADATVTFSYDAVGRLILATDTAGGTIENQYDALDRLTAQTQPLGTISYQYDVLGRRTQMQAPGVAPVVYGYDAASRLTTITQAPLTPVTIAYDAAGRRTKLTLPNQVSTEYQYDTASRLTALIYRNALGPLGDLSYEYDAAGNRTGVGGSFARTLLPDPVPTAKYDAANRQLQFGDKTLTFDPNGNTTSLLDGSGATAFTWDARDRLAAVNASGLEARFTYTFGRRVRKTVNSLTTQYLLDGLDVVQQLDPDGTATYLRTLAIDETLGFTRAEGTFSLIADPLGSSVAVTDAAGLVATAYSYDSFGSTTTTTAGIANAYQFTGRESDGIASLYYYRARYYHPGLARFISEDPLGRTLGIHLYAYASNNPITFLDLLGLITWPGQGDVTSKFGGRGGQFAGFHNGADIQNPNGGFVVAADSGLVIPVRQDGRGGNQVGVLHPDGSVTIYSHTSSLVKPGDEVREGQSIGLTDTSGRTTGNHVHFIYYPKGLGHPPADPERGYLPASNNYPKHLRR